MAESPTKTAAVPTTTKRAPAPQSGDWVCSNAALRDAGGEPITPGECVSDFDAWPEHQRYGVLGMGWVMRRGDYEKFRARDVVIAVPEPRVLASVPRKPQRAPTEAQLQQEIEDSIEFNAHDIDPTEQAVNRPRMPRVTKVPEMRPGESVTLSNGDLVEVPDYKPRAGASDTWDDAPIECEKCRQVFPGETARKAHDVRVHGFDAFAEH